MSEAIISRRYIFIDISFLLFPLDFTFKASGLLLLGYKFSDYSRLVEYFIEIDCTVSNSVFGVKLHKHLLLRIKAKVTLIFGIFYPAAEILYLSLSEASLTSAVPLEDTFLLAPFSGYKF